MMLMPLVLMPLVTELLAKIIALTYDHVQREVCN
jgi:hypothetical protein